MKGKQRSEIVKFQEILQTERKYRGRDTVSERAAIVMFQKQSKGKGSSHSNRVGVSVRASICVDNCSVFVNTHKAGFPK
jgi:hypothetical protein